MGGLILTTNYKRGAAIEYKAIEQLERVGYQADRTAGSHGEFDVIARFHTHARYIQTKLTLDPKTKYDVDIEKIEQAVLPPNSTGELWVWYSDKNPKNSGWIVQKIIKVVA
jgi:hypothetical protein